MAKNPGPKLFFSQVGGEQPIPPEFVAAMQRAEERQAVPNEVGPEELSDTIIESKVETDRTGERERTTVKKASGNIVLQDLTHDEGGNPIQVTRTLYPTGSTLAPITSTNKVAVHDLGNGWSIQEVTVDGSYVDGVFVPGIFPGPRYVKEIPDVVPERFRVAVPTTTTDINVEGVAVVPTLGVGDLRKSEEQTTDYIKRTSVATRASVPVPQTLVGKDTTVEKQIATVTETYKAAGGDAVPNATKDVTVQNLGDGRVIQTERTVAAVFDPVRMASEIPDVVPERFRVAVPTETEEHVVPGTAVVEQVLGPGELAKEEQLVTAFTKKTKVVGRAGVTLPVPLSGKDTNTKKQVVTVLETYKNAGGDAVPTATKDVKVENLGDGRVLQTETTVPAVFADAQFSAELTESVPPEFRALLVTARSGLTAPGTASPPTLQSGERSRQVTQVDAFNLRTEIATRGAIGGSTLTDKYFGGVEAEGSLFSGFVTRLKTYSPNTIQNTDASFFQFASKVTSLGSGDSVKETDTISIFPTLAEHVTDPGKLTVKRVKTIVDPDTALPTEGFVSRKPLDNQRSLQIVETVTNTALVADTYQTFPGFMDIELPSVLRSVKIGTSAGQTEGDYSETGAYALTLGGSGSISLNGNCRGSSMVLPHVIPDIWEPWGRNVRVQHFIFPVGRTHANLYNGFEISLWSYYFGAPGGIIFPFGTLNPWPKWCPKQVNVITTGTQRSIDVLVNVHAADGLAIDYLGAIKHIGQARTSGLGASGSLEFTQSTVRIPPTIHGTLTATLLPGNILSYGAFNTTGLINVSGTGYNFNFWGTVPATSGAFSINDTGATTIAATPGTTSIPTSGLYLVKLFMEPYKYDLVMMHYVVVDFADILQ